MLGRPKRKYTDVLYVKYSDISISGDAEISILINPVNRDGNYTTMTRSTTQV